MSEIPVRVVVTYRVCQHWRAHIFAKLNARDDLDLAVFHGASFPGTKLLNGEKLEGFENREHFTLKIPGGKIWGVQPGMFFSLIAHRPDVVLSEGGSNLLTNFFVLAYAKLFRRPVIWWTLGELRGQAPRGLLKRIFRSLVVLQEKLCNVYLGYSDVALNYFRRMGYPERDCFVAVNCVDTNRVFENIATRGDNVKALRERYDLEDKQVILFVGAFTQPKRIDRLLRAFSELHTTFPAARLMLVGDGQCAGDLKELVDELEMSDKVLFTGAVVEHVSDYYELGDVFVLPGLGGLAISEAMAHGMPVLCTYADGCEVNLVVDGETGFRLFSDDDDEVESFLVDKLNGLLSDEDLRQQLSDQARERIKSKHNVNTYIDKIVESIHHANGTATSG
ncbi:MAG: glycosyltransferase family 4 protein [Planctomycetota bacterium]